MAQYRLDENKANWREVENEIVVLDANAQEYLTISASGVALWPLLVEGAELDDLARRLVEEYGIDEATATDDARAFVGDLARRGLLQS